MEPTKLPIPEVNVDPLGDLMIDYLIGLDREEPFLDFKETIDYSKENFAKIAKDIFAFSNNGSGTILVGFKDSKNLSKAEEQRGRSYVPVGLPDEFSLDQAVLQEKFNSYSNLSIELGYREFYKEIGGATSRFAAIFIPPSTAVLKPSKDGYYIGVGDKRKIAFREGVIFIRRGTQSIQANETEVKYIEKRSEIAGFRNSVLTGVPDYFPEKLYSNLLKFTKIPSYVVEVTNKSGEFSTEVLDDLRKYRLPFYHWSRKLFTFHDDDFISALPREKYEELNVSHAKVIDFFKEDEKSQIIFELFEKEIEFFARKIGLFYYRSRYRSRLYFPSKERSRTEYWDTRYRKNSPVLVATNVYSEKSKRYLTKHRCVDFDFIYFEDGIFLNLRPSLILTEDGRRVVNDFNEGYLITKDLYRNRNSLYLNSLLFWAFKLSSGRNSIELIPSELEIDSNPTQLDIDTGIAWDRPATEALVEL